MTRSSFASSPPLHPLEDGDQPHPFPILGRLGVGGGCLGGREGVRKAGPRTSDAPGRGMWAGPPLPDSTGEGGCTQGSKTQVSGVESQLRVFLPAPGGEAQTSPVSWCLPWATAQGFLRRFKMEMAQAASAWDEMLPCWVGCEGPWEVWGAGGTEVEGATGSEGRERCLLFECVYVWGAGRRWRN